MIHCYGGIPLPPTSKINYVNMQRNYVNMQHCYNVNMKIMMFTCNLNYVTCQHNHVNKSHVNILCCMFTLIISHLRGRSMPPYTEINVLHVPKRDE